MKIGIAGYGNLGRGVEAAISRARDAELSVVFTRRDPSDVVIATSGVPVCGMNEMHRFVGKLDVVILCGGSATDLPEQTPECARDFNVVDSFDTHANIPDHYEEADRAARESGHVAIISCGWDPGLFSVNRAYASAVLPDGKDYTFWGKGVSQGHSDAIRRIEGVEDARQYTVPVEAALEAVRSGGNPEMTARQKHTRECYVVAKAGADRARIEREIVTMPNYFADYDTTVHFITKEQMAADHVGMPHGGFVIRTGSTGTNGEYGNVIEYSLKLDSNPAFTASVLVAYARAAVRLSQTGVCGAKTVLDVPPALLSPLDPETLRRTLL